MAVLFDNVGSAGGNSVTSLSFALVIGSSADRAVIVGFTHRPVGQTAYTVTVGGEACVEIAGTAVEGVLLRSVLWGKATTLTGSQTVSGAWTTAADSVMGAVSVSGVNQTTPFNNGVNAKAESGSPSLAITSTNGDLTVDNAASISALTAPSQTQRYQTTTSSASGQGSTGPGTGSATHSWTQTPSDRWSQSGVNFIAEVGVAVAAVGHGLLLTNIRNRMIQHV